MRLSDIGGSSPAPCEGSGAPRPGLDVSRPVSGPGPRTFSGVKREVRKVRWQDTGEIAPARRAENGDLVVDVAPYPHGVNSVVRVGEAM